MSDQGYTLAEMLAALLIVGLAVGGLAQGLRVISRLQAGAAQQLQHERAARHAEAQFVRLLAGQGPFRSTQEGFSGDAAGFVFPCGEKRVCGATLLADGDGAALEVAANDGQRRKAVLRKAANARFTYEGDTESYERWPPQDDVQTLRAVRIVQGDTPVMAARLWTQQPRECEFDSIAQGCREAAR